MSYDCVFQNANAGKVYELPSEEASVLFSSVLKTYAGRHLAASATAPSTHGQRRGGGIQRAPCEFPTIEAHSTSMISPHPDLKFLAQPWHLLKCSYKTPGIKQLKNSPAHCSFSSPLLRWFLLSSTFCSSFPFSSLCISSCPLQTLLLPHPPSNLLMCRNTFSRALSSPTTSGREFVPLTPTFLLSLVVQVLPHRCTLWKFCRIS